MTSPTGSEPRTPSLYHALPVVQAILLVVAAVACLLATATLCDRLHVPPLAGIALAELAFAAVPLGYVLLERDLPQLGLRRSAPRHIVAGLLVGATLWYANVMLVRELFPPDAAEHLRRLVVDESLALALLSAVVLAPFAEEVVFRGVLARSLAARLPRLAAVAISAAAFSAFHVSLVQMLPTFTIGAALAYISLRAGSIVPAIAGHMTNNLIAVVLTRLATGDDADHAAPTAAELALAAVALAITAGGLAMSARGRA